MAFNNNITTYTARGFFLGLTAFQRAGIANDVLGGWAFDRAEWAELLGATVVDAVWLRELAACVRAEGY